MDNLWIISMVTGWWLSLPLWKIWVRQLGWWHSQVRWKNRKCSKPPARIVRISACSEKFPWRLFADTLHMKSLSWIKLLSQRSKDLTHCWLLPTRKRQPGNLYTMRQVSSVWLQLILSMNQTCAPFAMLDRNRDISIPLCLNMFLARMSHITSQLSLRMLSSHSLHALYTFIKKKETI